MAIKQEARFDFERQTSELTMTGVQESLKAIIAKESVADVKSFRSHQLDRLGKYRDKFVALLSGLNQGEFSEVQLVEKDYDPVVTDLLFFLESAKEVHDRLFNGIFGRAIAADMDFLRLQMLEYKVGMSPRES